MRTNAFWLERRLGNHFAACAARAGGLRQRFRCEDDAKREADASFEEVAARPGEAKIEYRTHWRSPHASLDAAFLIAARMRT
jgi:hypothetical protein